MPSISYRLKQNLEKPQDENLKANLIKNIKNTLSIEILEENYNIHEKLSHLVSSVIKYISENFQKEELFYNFLKIGV